MTAGLRSALPPALVLLGLALLMEAAKAAGLLPITVPAPTQVLAVIPAQFADLVYHGAATLRSALLGYLCAGLVAGALASVALRFHGAERPIISFGLLVDCFPLIALAPIFVIWLGQGMLLHVTLSAIASFFPLLLGTVKGFRATDASTRQLFHVMAATPMQRLRLLSVPAALPYIFQAMKIAAPLALLGALIAEWIGAERGLGAMMIYALFSFNVPVVWLTILTVCGLSALAYGLIALVESRVITWEVRGDAGGTDG
ncbi:ABC transporter permease [Marinibacterium profundimaris]|uniref:ABC transporter permease n=1 Tax=Marinibacterium profundimaris TaxID=1679460 RepID=UPI000B520F66|nr:ABC transporter permease subunit [Marinibacterium profundimaris]